MTAQRRQGQPWRVVLDTNVLVSALLFTRGPAVQVRHAWQARRVLPLVSHAKAAELVRVLAYPMFKLSAEEQQELLADYLPAATVVVVATPPPPVPHCRDPHDLPFPYLAAAGRAEALVTGDADLLALAGQTSFRIVSVTQFLHDLSR